MTEREKKFRQAARQIVLIFDVFENDRDRIDKEVMDIFRKNMDMSLNWVYNKRKSLSEQYGILSETYTIMNFLIKYYILPKRGDGKQEERDRLEKFKKLLEAEKGVVDDKNESDSSILKEKKRMYEKLVNKENENKYSQYYEYSESQKFYKKMFSHTQKDINNDRYLLRLKHSKYKRMMNAASQQQEVLNEPQKFEDKYGGIEEYNELLEKRNFYRDTMLMSEKYTGGESLDFMEWLRERYKVFMRKESEQI